jgi:uncharacterized RDD family membrane protein YckC
MDEKSTTGTAAGLPRRAAALLYDALLVLALALVTTFAMLPLTGGEALLVSTRGALGHLYHAVLLLVVYAYFGWCWTHGGQTLGMRAWRIALEDSTGGPITWAAAAGRFLLGIGMLFLALTGAWYLRAPASALARAGAAMLLAPAVLDFAWIVFDRDSRSLLDLALGTRVLHRRG